MTMNETAGTNSIGLPLQSARTRRFSLGVPRQFTVSPDGERVLFIRTTGGTDPVSRLWLYEDGAERMLADPAALRRDDADGGAVPQEELTRRERAREMSSGWCRTRRTRTSGSLPSHSGVSCGWCGRTAQPRAGSPPQGRWSIRAPRPTAP